MTTLHEAAQMALEALELARRSHGTMLMSDPPQEAWKANRVDSALLNAIEAMRSALAQQPVAYLWFPPKKPELAKLSFQKDPSASLKGLGYVSRPLVFGDTTAPAAQPPQKHIWCLGSKTVTMAFWSEEAARKAQASFPASMHFELYRVDLLDAAPAAQPQWVDLTIDEIDAAADAGCTTADGTVYAHQFYVSVSAALREKNTATPAAQPQCDHPNACAHPFCSCGGSHKYD